MLTIGQRIDVFEMLPSDRYQEEPTGSYRVGFPDLICSTALTYILGKYAYTFDNHLEAHGIGQDVKKVGTLIITKVK